MIDIHAHIIPSIDDGCSNVNEAIAAIKKAEAYGITKIFATPHFMKGTVDNYKGKITNKVDSLNNVLKSLGVETTAVYGSEIMISVDIVDLLKAGSLASLNGSRYILIEFPMHVKVPNIYALIRDIISTGYIPIIAHPERYSYIIRDINEAIKYVESGALLQINISSLIGTYGEDVKEAAVNLLKHNLVHFWGSDYHSFRDVYDKDKLDKAFKVLKKIVGEDKYTVITKVNPECVYNDLDIKTFEIKYKKGLFR